MSLQVFSARIGCKDPDVLDVTRQNGTDGLFLAPSWPVLKPFLAARKKADAVMAAIKAEATRLGGYEDAKGHPTFDPFIYQLEAEQIMDRAWRNYLPAYLDEMRRSYRTERAKWDALLARPRVVLVCFCTDPLHCHRWILQSEILPKLGATDCGELARREVLS